MSTNSLKVLSWNTLESGSGGAWNNGWGCPLEISRRDELLTFLPSLSEENAENQLTEERYQRIETTISNDLHDLDLILIQELTADNPWKFPSTFLETGSTNNTEQQTQQDERGEWEMLADATVCNLNTPTIQRMYYRSSTLQFIDSNPLLNSNTPGCLAVFSYDGEKGEGEESNDDNNEIFYLANIHASARGTRTPSLRPTVIQDLLIDIETSLSTMEGWSNVTTILPGMICGDWNAHLATIQEAFDYITTNTTINYAAAMLINATDGDVFSTNHQAGWIAQYDGCIYTTTSTTTPHDDGGERSTTTSSSSLEVANVSHNTTGFMPKGINGNLTGLFAFDDEQDGVYYNGKIIEGSNPSESTSDHLRVVTKFTFVNRRQENDGGDDNNDTFVEDDPQTIATTPPSSETTQPTTIDFLTIPPTTTSSSSSANSNRCLASSSISSNIPMTILFGMTLFGSAFG